MPDLAACVFKIRPDRESRWGFHLANIFRQWFVDQLALHLPDLHQQIAGDNQLRPFTVSGLYGNRRSEPFTSNELYSWRITTLLPELTDWLLTTGMSVMIGQVIPVGETRLHVMEAICDPAQDLLTDCAEISHLLQSTSLNTAPLSRNIGLRFHSPTTFRKQGLNEPFPTPERVFGSLLDRWNTFNDVELHPNTREFASSNIEVSRFRLNTEFVKYDNPDIQPISGSIGYCRYHVLSSDRYWAGIIHALAAYALYAGVGYRTALGFGQVSVME